MIVQLEIPLIWNLLYLRFFCIKGVLGFDLDGLLHFEALSDFFYLFAFWSFRVCLFKRDTLY
jgi:hypothetical protein